jgi:hypothetical protein
MALTKLSSSVEQAICQAILAGSSIEVAAEYVGIGRRTFYRWCSRGRKAKRGVFWHFWHALKKARAAAEVRTVARLLDAAPQTWQAAAWWLERKAPNRWALRDRRELNRLSEEVKTLRHAINSRAQEGAS